MLIPSEFCAYEGSIAPTIFAAAPHLLPFLAQAVIVRYCYFGNTSNMRVLVLTARTHINIVRRRFANLIMRSNLYGTKLYVKETVVPEQYGITFPLHSPVLRLHAHISPLVFRSSILVSFVSLFYRTASLVRPVWTPMLSPAIGLSDNIHGASYLLDPT
jgi:hypothetical protein